MTCEETLDRLSAYMDDECDAVQSRDLERHVATCADCAAALASARALGDALRASVLYHAAPESLRDRLAPPLPLPAAHEPAARARARRARPAWLAAAAAALVVVGTAWLAAGIAGRGAEAGLADDVVSAHVRSLMADHLTDVTSTDQHTVKPWFAGKLDYSPAVTDLAAEGFPLVGGRLDYVDHRAVAALVYMRRKHVINVFVWPAGGADAAGAGVHAVAPRGERGYHVVRVDSDGLERWFVSDLNADELSAFARRVATMARGS